MDGGLNLVYIEGLCVIGFTINGHESQPALECRCGFVPGVMLTWLIGK